MIFVKPAPGKRVRREDGTLLPENGDSVNETKHWNRLIRYGDVVIIEKAS